MKKLLTLLILTILLITLLGCTQTTDNTNTLIDTTPTNNTTPSGSTTPSELCSNSEYSTREQDLGYEKNIQLDYYKSSKNLKSEISTRGNSALDDIKDLTCLDYLDLSYSDVTDISAP